MRSDSRREWTGWSEPTPARHDHPLAGDHVHSEQRSPAVGQQNQHVIGVVDDDGLVGIFEAGAATWLDVETANLQLRSANLAQLRARHQRELAAIRLAGASGTL